jgi:hypothetical protein
LNRTAPLVGRKKELADILRLVKRGAELVTITGPPGAGKKRLAKAIISEAPDARSAIRVAPRPLGLPGEREYPLRPLAEAPAVELYRLVSGDDETPYKEVAALTRETGRYPGDIVDAYGQ